MFHSWSLHPAVPPRKVSDWSNVNAARFSARRPIILHYVNFQKARLEGMEGSKYTPPGCWTPPAVLRTPDRALRFNHRRITQPLIIQRCRTVRRMCNAWSPDQKAVFREPDLSFFPANPYHRRFDVHRLAFRQTHKEHLRANYPTRALFNTLPYGRKGPFASWPAAIFGRLSKKSRTAAGHPAHQLLYTERFLNTPHRPEIIAQIRIEQVFVRHPEIAIEAP
jgi:hypothetical protein